MSDKAQDTEPMEEVGMLHYVVFGLEAHAHNLKAAGLVDMRYYRCSVPGGICRSLLSEADLRLVVFLVFPFEFSTASFLFASGSSFFRSPHDGAKEQQTADTARRSRRDEKKYCSHALCVWSMRTSRTSTRLALHTRYIVRGY